MREILDKYVKSKFGDIEIPSDAGERLKLARTLLGSSIVNNLDYWLDNSKDYLDNDNPQEPFTRENEFSRKDEFFRAALSKLDPDTKDAIKKLIDSTTTGLLFSLLTNFDQFDFGKLTISLKPKSDIDTEIKISSDNDDLHDQLSEWIYFFSKYKKELVAKEENAMGTSFRFL